MKIIYKYSESTEKPLALEICSNHVYLRKNIEVITRNDSVDKAVKYYTYEEACLTIEEFKEYANQQVSINAIKGINDSEKISIIKEEQTLGNENQIAIMEAIADLYALIASMK